MNVSASLGDSQGKVMEFLCRALVWKDSKEIKMKESTCTISSASALFSSLSSARARCKSKFVASSWSILVTFASPSLAEWWRSSRLRVVTRILPDTHGGKNFFSFKLTSSALSKRRSQFPSRCLASQRRLASADRSVLPGVMASRSVWRVCSSVASM